MYDLCDCEAGSYCHKYSVSVTPREHQYLMGTSGLPREDEEVYISRILGQSTSIGFIEKAVNLGRSLLRHALNGLRSVPDAIQATRLSICDQCDYLKEDDSCAKCGCPVWSKTAWASEECPLKKWGRFEASGGCGCGCGK